MHTFTADQLRWFRMRRSGLVTPFATSEEAASTLVGVQAQFLVAGALALWNRVPALDYATVERLLFEDRTLVKLWGQRGTLHLYPSEEWPLIHAMLAGQPSWWEGQLAKTKDPEAVARAEEYFALLGQLEAMLRERETMGRSDLRSSELAFNDWHLSSWGGIFAGLVRRGHAVHVQQSGGEGRFAHRTHWLPDLAWEELPPDEASATIMRRYLAVYGPATLQDFVYWRGTTLVHAGRWLKALGDEVVEVTSEGKTMMALRDDVEALHETPPDRKAWPVRLLYRFDPYLLGLRDKTWVVDKPFYNEVWRPAGHIEGTILEHGRIVGTWRYDRRGTGLAVTLRPFGTLPRHARTAAKRAAEGIAAFFGVPLTSVDGL